VESQTWVGASEITRFELLSGVRPGKQKEVERLSSELGWVPVTEGIAIHAAALARTYRASHEGIEDADYLIAATALDLEARLLTTNVRHFPMLSGLEPAYERRGCRLGRRPLAKRHP
jgi:predicted nucleic acid-binding protein